VSILAPNLAFIVVDRQGKYIKSYDKLRYAKSFRTRNGGLYDIYRTVTVEKVEVE
jgi:hypothetical protein